jgi:hypothetical protein
VLVSFRNGRPSNAGCSGSRLRQKRRGEPASGDGRSPVAAGRIANCYRLLGQSSQVVMQRFECLEAPKVPCVDVGDAGGSGLAQRVKARFVLGFLALDKPDTLTLDFAGVLVPAGHNQSLDQPSLMIGQDNVARWHDVSCSRWHSMPMNPGLQGLSGEASHCRRGGVQRPAGRGRPACRLGRSWTEPACPRVARCI